MLAELAAAAACDDSSLSGFGLYALTIDGVTEIPVQGAGRRRVLRSSGRRRRPGAPSPPGPVLGGWIDEWEMLRTEGNVFTMLTVHDWIAGRATASRLLERLLARVQASPAPRHHRGADGLAHHEASVNRALRRCR